MGLPSSVVKTLAAASANNISLSQSPGAAGNLLINGSAASGGVATLDTQRRVIITSAGNDSGRTFTVYGTNQTGNQISESIAGANVGAAATLSGFLTVTRISVDAATAAAVTAGTNGVGSTPWQTMNWHIAPFQVTVAVIVSGTVNYTVEYTYDDPNNLPAGITQPGIFSPTAMTAQTTTLDGSLVGPVAAVRLTINSGAGSVRFITLQSDISGA